MLVLAYISGISCCLRSALYTLSARDRDFVALPCLLVDQRIREGVCGGGRERLLATKLYNGGGPGRPCLGFRVWDEERKLHDGGVQGVPVLGLGFRIRNEIL